MSTPQQPMIVIKNNSVNEIISTELFNQPSLSSNANANTTYTWDITSELYNNKDSVSIQAKTVDQLSFQTYVFTTESITTPEEVVSILNSFNIGFFSLVRTGGAILIRVRSDILQYDDLNIFRQNNALPVFSTFNSGQNNNRRMNNNSTTQLVILATDADGDPISYSVTNLPSFATLTEYNFAGLYYCVIDFITTGPGDNGTYNFTVNASDGFGTTQLPISVVVDGSSYPTFDRPYIDTRSIAVGDISQLWEYFTSAGFTGSSIFSRPPVSWGGGSTGISILFAPDPITSEIGEHILGAFINLGLGVAYDSIVIQVTVTPV